VLWHHVIRFTLTMEAVCSSETLMPVCYNTGCLFWYTRPLIFASLRVSDILWSCTIRAIRNLYVKGKAIPVQAWTGCDGRRRLRLPGFSDSWRTKVARLVICTGRLYPQGRSPVLVSIRRWNDCVELRGCILYTNKSLQNYWNRKVDITGIKTSCWGAEI
jgi:hypothetical protein